jgi:hypothetical protein
MNQFISFPPDPDPFTSFISVSPCPTYFLSSSASKSSFSFSSSSGPQQTIRAETIAMRRIKAVKIAKNA